MVNYCCIPRCNRNSRIHRHLNFYGLPKEKHRVGRSPRLSHLLYAYYLKPLLEDAGHKCHKIVFCGNPCKRPRSQKQWLKLACRDDLLSKDLDKLRKTLRFCSRHFPPSAIVNKHLTQDALPSKSLPGSIEEDEPDIEPEKHEGIICDSCQNPVQGFRYKCVKCENFDLCQKCEMLERHSQHYMLRIPKSIKFQLADDLINKWRNLFLREHISPDSDTSDDEPVTKYIRNYDSGIDLTEDVKNDIRSEVARALKAVKEKVPVQVVPKRSNKRKESALPALEYCIKKVKGDDSKVVEDNLEENPVAPELVFADVNSLKFDQPDIKPVVDDTFSASSSGLAVSVPNSNMSVENQPMLYVTLSNDLSQFMIELTPDSNANGSNIMK